MRALSEEQADRISPGIERQLAAIEERETEALDELRMLGFRVTLHTLPRYTEEDILVGTKAGWVNGDCYAVLYDRSGKRKHVSGISAIDTLAQAKAWQRWQDGLKNDAPNRFHATAEDVPEVAVTNRVAGDTAETALKRENTRRRVLSFESGTAEIVDANGAPIEETHASQFSTPNQKVTT
jgi:hypothetical protein